MNWKMCSDEFLHFSFWNTLNTIDLDVFRISANEYKLSSKMKWDNAIKLQMKRDLPNTKYHNQDIRKGKRAEREAERVAEKLR